MSVGTGGARRWLLNVASGYASVAAEGVVFLALTPFLVHYVGVDRYALWVLAGTIVFYLKFLDLGFAGAQIRYHARFAARDQHDDIRRLARTVVLGLTVAGCVALAAGLLIAAAAQPAWFTIEPEQIGEFRALLALLTVEIFVLFPASGLDNIYEGAQRFDVRNLRAVALLGVKTLAQIAALMLGHGLLVIAAIEVIATSLQLLLDLTIINRLLPGLLKSPVGFDLGIWRRIRGFALWSFLDDLLMSGTARLGNLFVASFLSLALLTPYSLCVSVTGLLLHAIHPIADTFFPLATQLHAQGRREELGQLLLTGTKGLLALCAPLAVVLAFTGEAMIALWVPATRGEIPHGLVALLTADVTISVILSTPAVVLIAVNGIRSFVLLTAAEILLFAVLAWLLAPGANLHGLALAALLSNIVTGFGVMLPLVARVTKVPLARLIGLPVMRVVLACLPAVGLAMLNIGWRDDTIPGVGLHALTLGTACVAGLLLWGASRSERSEYLQLWRDAR